MKLHMQRTSRFQYRKFPNLCSALMAIISLDLSATGTTFAQRVVVEQLACWLTNVTVVDTHTGNSRRAGGVAIQGGKITKIDRAGTLVASGSARSIDGRGKFVVPGYWEMHGHPIDGQIAR